MRALVDHVTQRPCLIALRGVSDDHCLTFSQVELRGLEPLTPYLQSDVFACRDRADLVSRLSVSSCQLAVRTPANGTLMARTGGSGGHGHLRRRNLAWGCVRFTLPPGITAGRELFRRASSNHLGPGPGPAFAR
jgi:hypothetical protein